MSESAEDKSERLSLSIATLGIVYGDIGTSPLYAFRESFLGTPGLSVDNGHIFGVLSMIVWSLIIVISIKYLQFVMRADNEGEGGIVALVTLLRPGTARYGTRRWWLVMIGLFGAALLYGDGTITPAISVLSALEGLDVIQPGLRPYVVPMTVVILVSLFSVQRMGTAAIGRLFGPIMLVWFLVLGILGLIHIIKDPVILKSFNPYWAASFIINQPDLAFIVLGAVFLAVTGGETLYADMGHFGVSPIRRSWYFLVFPAVVLNYLGQGALVVADKHEITHPFYHLAPEWALLPMVILSTLATIIASQAVISGVFSLTRQAINLGQLPMLKVVHTSNQAEGQIYIPAVNWLLMLASVGLVLSFKTSSNLSSAYGLAISMDMVITTFLIIVLARHWKWPRAAIWVIILVFLPLDLAYLASNSLKIAAGGWYPLAVGGLVFFLMSTWRKGVKAQRESLSKKRPRIEELPAILKRRDIRRPSGVAIFILGPNDNRVPATLTHLLDRLKSVPQQIILLRINVETYPDNHPEKFIEYRSVTPAVHVVDLRYGFTEHIHLPSAMARLGKRLPGLDLENATYIVEKDVVLTSHRRGMSRWRDSIFGFMKRNSNRETTYFGIPPENTIEIGIRVEL